MAEAVEDLVEVAKDAGASDLGDVVEALAGVVADTRLLIVKALQNWRDEQVEKQVDVWNETDGARSEADKSTLAVVNVARPRKLLRQQIDYGRNAVLLTILLAALDERSNLQRRGFALIV